MAAYQTVDEIKARVHYRKEDFDLDTNDFQTLLETVEEESRALIESFMGDFTFEKETDRVDVINSSYSEGVPLVYPVDKVSKVEYKRRASSDWEELDEDHWYNTEHRLVLDRYPRQYERRRHFHRRIGDRKRKWKDISTQISVTYDRGYDNIPANVKNIQLDIINKILRRLKNEQSVSAMDPEQMQALELADKVMSDDILERLNQITRLKNVVRSV